MVESSLSENTIVPQQSSNEVLVQCVKSGSKLRMRIVSGGVYSQQLNCQAPKSIRTPGALYRLRNPTIRVQQTGSATFYKLSNDVTLYEPVQLGVNLQVSAVKTWLTKQQLKDMGIPVFEEPDCVICLTNAASVILLPCSHKQFCKQCIVQQESTSAYYSWQKKQNKCCICRQPYTKYYEVIEDTE